MTLTLKKANDILENVGHASQTDTGSREIETMDQLTVDIFGEDNGDETIAAAKDVFLIFAYEIMNIKDFPVTINKVQDAIELALDGDESIFDHHDNLFPDGKLSLEVLKRINELMKIAQTDDVAEDIFRLVDEKLDQFNVETEDDEATPAPRFS